MSYFNIVSQSDESTVVAEYTPQSQRSEAYQSEADLENEFIRLLCELGYERLAIHKEADLIANLRTQLEKLNDYRFTDGEWQRFWNEVLANSNSGILEKTRLIQEDYESLNSRPMKRIIEPLTMMGANISSILRNGCAPLYIAPGNLHGIHYDSPVSSAQVKSCILLAGLYAEGETSVTEPSLSRNHTELMLKEFGADIRTLHSLSGTEATAYIKPYPKLYGQKIVVPGDISSAAYFIAAGLIVPDSEILIEHVGINPTRSGILKVCEDMGGDITLLNERCEAGEKIADILVRTRSLHGITIEGDIIPTLIDEIPIIAVMAAVADGTTVIKDAAELKVKETDRIETVTDNLKAMGCNVTPTEDGMIITGGTLHGASIHTLLDHRIAMAFSIAALVADGTTKILDSKCVDVSYPTFYDTFEQLL